MIWRQNGLIGQASFDPWRNPGAVTNIKPMVPDNMNNPLVRRAMRANDNIIDFMNWSILPMARIEQEGCDNKVLFSDARFGPPLSGSRFLRIVALPNSVAACGGKKTQP
jgi:hypothetical protein